MVDERNRMERVNNSPKSVQSNKDNNIYHNGEVDVKAKYPGGEDELQKWVTQNAIYPTMAEEDRVQGRVYVQFVVEKDGSISNVKMVWGHQYFEMEAVRVVKSIPKKFIPAMLNGVTVRSRFTLPITFKLKNIK